MKPNLFYIAIEIFIAIMLIVVASSVHPHEVYCYVGAGGWLMLAIINIGNLLKDKEQEDKEPNKL